MNSIYEIVNLNGYLYLLDVTDTWSYGWEGAFSPFDEEAFRAKWEIEMNRPYTIEDILEFGETFNGFNNWTVVSSNHKTSTAAEKKLRAAVKRHAKERQ